MHHFMIISGKVVTNPLLLKNKLFKNTAELIKMENSWANTIWELEVSN
jgi:hypothetical protein